MSLIFRPTHCNAKLRGMTKFAHRKEYRSDSVKSLQDFLDTSNTKILGRPVGKLEQLPERTLETPL